jgi:hypothetical protein
MDNLFRIKLIGKDQKIYFVAFSRIKSIVAVSTIGNASLMLEKTALGVSSSLRTSGQWRRVELVETSSTLITEDSFGQVENTASPLSGVASSFNKLASSLNKLSSDL